jgi:hypothetical protein
MANNLSKTNIVNGNVIEAADITQLVDALTATAAYNITISGSFVFSGSTTGSGWFENAVSASRSITASYADFANTASFALAAFQANTAISSSYALTASYALNATTPFEISASTYSGSSITNAAVKFVVGSGQTSAGVPPFDQSPVIAELVGYSPSDLGDKVFINVSPINVNDNVWVAAVAFPSITFESGLGGTEYHYHITYRQ